MTFPKHAQLVGVLEDIGGRSVLRDFFCAAPWPPVAPRGPPWPPVAGFLLNRPFWRPRPAHFSRYNIFGGTVGCGYDFCDTEFAIHYMRYIVSDT